MGEMTFTFETRRTTGTLYRWWAEMWSDGDDWLYRDAFVTRRGALLSLRWRARLHVRRKRLERRAEESKQVWKETFPA